MSKLTLDQIIDKYKEAPAPAPHWTDTSHDALRYWAQGAGLDLAAYAEKEADRLRRSSRLYDGPDKLPESDESIRALVNSAIRNMQDELCRIF